MTPSKIKSGDFVFPKTYILTHSQFIFNFYWLKKQLIPFKKIVTIQVIKSLNQAKIWSIYGN